MGDCSFFVLYWNLGRQHPQLFPHLLSRSSHLGDRVSQAGPALYKPILAASDHSVVPYVLCDGIQDDQLRNLPQYWGTTDGTVVPWFLLPALLVYWSHVCWPGTSSVSQGNEGQLKCSGCWSRWQREGSWGCKVGWKLMAQLATVQVSKMIWVVMEEMEAGSLEGWEAKGTSCNEGNIIWKYGTIFAARVGKHGTNMPTKTFDSSVLEENLKTCLEKALRNLL